MPTKANASASKPSRKAAEPTSASKMSALEKRFTSEAVESFDNLERPSLSFLNSIKKVLIRPSKFKDDKNYALIIFNNGNRLAVSLDYSVSAKPGDTLSKPSLMLGTYTNDEGEEKLLIYGEVK